MFVSVSPECDQTADWGERFEETDIRGKRSRNHLRWITTVTVSTLPESRCELSSWNCLCLPTELQKQLEEKQDELKAKTEEVERLIANPAISECSVTLSDQTKAIWQPITILTLWRQWIKFGSQDVLLYVLYTFHMGSLPACKTVLSDWMAHYSL